MKHSFTWLRCCYFLNVRSSHISERSVWLALVVTGLLGLLISGPVQAGINEWTSNGPEGGFILSLAVDPQTPTTPYAGTNNGGVFKSIDGGANWSAINTGLTHTIVYALAIDPGTPTTLYAGTDGGGGVCHATGVHRRLSSNKS